MLENNADPERMKELLNDEVVEFNEVIGTGDTDKIAQELADIVFFTFSIANMMGIDLENTFWAKCIRNEFKYPEEYFNNGMSYEEASTMLRALWDRSQDDEFHQLAL
jgi:NTP pyrophosphatase (non-canonical NTP hydrolase)